ncbi:unnamed protein product [Vicia faba]|uniref:Protein kinase domain-containing protein n=1 Tax=Vicia faba TaxID=3906 RepID=A0AAV1AQP3_VICFA|nr:unnamed protein product [Vicia faba]
MESILVLFLFYVVSTNSISVAASPTTSNSLCPVDMNYVLTVPWNTSTCLTKNKPQTSLCCQTLLSLFGIALAQNLNKNSLFQLPNLSTSTSCLQDFQTKLSPLSLHYDIVSSSVLVFNLSKIGSAVLGLKVQEKLNQIDGNGSHSKDCFYFTILYIAGVVNQFGPENFSVMSCILELPLNSQVVSRKKSHRALFFGLIRASVAFMVIMFSLLGFYVWHTGWLKHHNLVPLRGCCVVVEDHNQEHRNRYLVYDYMPNDNLEGHLFPSMDNEKEKKLLTWLQRKNITLDVAIGLVYLHFGVKPAIYHRDIKATNILLDAEMRARVADS